MNIPYFSYKSQSLNPYGFTLLRAPPLRKILPPRNPALTRGEEVDALFFGYAGECASGYRRAVTEVVWFRWRIGRYRQWLDTWQRACAGIGRCCWITHHGMEGISALVVHPTRRALSWILALS
ncbi:MAG: hypothetical protein ABTQ34_05085 [Bdellovibrionales bacterium]